jgi:tetratricopeptide (TPR) repeat protein
MQLLRSTCIFIGGLTLASAAHALPDLKKLNDDQLIALYDKVREAEDIKHCEEMAPILAEMLTRSSIEGELQQQKILTDFKCALDEGKWVTAYRLMRDVETALGEDLGRLGFLVALYSDHFDNAAGRMLAMIEVKDGEPLTGLDDQTFYQLMNELWTAKLFKQRYELATELSASKHFPDMSGNVQSLMASAIIDEEGRIGKFRRAPKLLDKLDSPYQFATYLSMRNFEPIWPQVEKAAGPAMQTVIDRQLKKDMALHRAKPDDGEAYQQAVHALFFAGKFEEVIEFASRIDHSAEGIGKIEENDAWALNVEAYALDSLGRNAEAETIFERLAAIPYDEDKTGWLVSFVINRGSRLVELGQWQRGLEAATLAGTIAEKSGNEYSRMLVRRDKICALVNLGRASETTSLLEEMYSLRKETYATTIAALLCIGDIDRAAQVAIEALSDPVYAEAIVDYLQNPEMQIYYTRSKLPRARDVLLVRADVRAAYEKVGRDIPDAFIPLAGRRRAELAADKP